MGSSPTTGTKNTASHGGAVFLHEWTRTRGRLETCRRHVSTRGGLRRSAGRVPPPAPKIERPMGGAVFLHERTRTRGRLETCRRHVSTRGGLRRSAGRVPPPAPKIERPMGALSFLHEWNSNPRALRNVPAARFNPRWPAPQRRSSPTTGTKNTAPHGDAAFFLCCCRQIVPVTVKTAVPGVIVQSPVAASCV